MADAEADAGGEATGRRRGKLPLLIGLVLALALGGGGFYAVWSGMLLGPAGDAGGDHAPDPVIEELAPVSFVPVDTLLVSLGPGSRASHLRFQSQLEVTPGQEGAVTALMPRIVDVLNSYLRAVEPAELEDPAALTRLRSQMLRRVQIVVGENRVQDLLIMEFVLN